MYTIIDRRHAACVALVLAGAIAAPSSARGQATPVGRIEGEVRDSLHSVPLANAIVVAVRMAPEPHTFASVAADDRGRFHFDSLLAGRYAVSFSSPSLDSLDLVVPEREVTLEAGQRLRVDLAMPSGLTLRRAACPGLPMMGAGQGAVVGTVTDAATERPLGLATVVVAWNDIRVDKATLRAVTEPRTGAVRADSVGHYRLCGVPTDQTLVLQVQHGGGSSGVVDVVVNDSVGMRRQDLSFAPEPASAATRADTGTARAVALPSATGTAVVSGVVRGAQNRPLADADLRIAGARGSTRSDSLGRFTLTGMPAGTQMLEARRIGYAMVRTPVELRSTRPVTQDMQLLRVVSLDSVRILAQRSRYPEFERHRKNGWGKFMDEADIMRRNPVRTGDLFRMMAGFHVQHNGFDEVLVSSRGSASLSGRACAVNVVVDGMQHMDLDMVHPSDIAAIEAYPGGNIPPEYAFSSPCGAVVIWTKR